MGTVALAPGPALTECEDPIIIVSTTHALNIPVGNNVNCEVLALVDRGNVDFENDAFFVFARPDKTLELRWHAELPPGHTTLGRVVYITVPFLEGMNMGGSSFLEDQGFSW